MKNQPTNKLGLLDRMRISLGFSNASSTTSSQKVDEPDENEELSQKWFDMLQNAQQESFKHAAVLLGQHCCHVINHGGFELLQGDHMMWFLNIQMLNLVVAENNCMSYQDRKGIAEMLGDILKNYDNKIEQCRKHGLKSEFIENMHAFRDEVLNRLQMRMKFECQENDDLTYVGGAIIAPVSLQPI